MHYEAMLDEIASVRLPERKPRANERGVKRKMSNYPIVRRSKETKPAKRPIAKVIIVC